MTQLQAVVIFVFIVFGLVFYFLWDLKMRLEEIASPEAAPPDRSPERPAEDVCVDCAKDTADRLESAAKEAYILLEKLERAEDKRDDSAAAAVTSAILKYETDIRRLRDLAAAQSGPTRRKRTSSGTAAYPANREKSVAITMVGWI